MAGPKGFAQRELAQREEILGAKEVCQRRLDAVRRIDLPLAQPLAQRLGSNVDENHFVGQRQNAVWERLAHDRSGEPQNGIAQAFEMLDVERRDDVDAGAQNGQDVVEALRRDRTGRIGMSELVDERDLRACARSTPSRSNSLIRDPVGIDDLRRHHRPGRRAVPPSPYVRAFRRSRRRRRRLRPGAGARDRASRRSCRHRPPRRGRPSSLP